MLIAGFLGATRLSALPSAQASAACSLNGAITASGSPLPGVVVTLVDADGRVVETSSTGLDGRYSLKLPGAPGSFTLRASLVAFAPIVRDVTLDPGSCAPRTDLEMTLASRMPQASANPQVAPAPSPATRGSLPSRGISGRGLETPNGQPQF